MSERKRPERKCILSNARHDPADGALMRFVCSPDGTVVADLKGNLPGRGAWLSATRNAVEQATARRAFARAFKRQVKVPDTLATDVERLLETRALDALGFARKAGECITGSGKVDSLIRNGRATALLHATDGADDGLRKLKQAIFAATGEEDGVELLRVFEADQMSLALGATHVIHAAMTSGGAAANALAHTRRLIAYRMSQDT